MACKADVKKAILDKTISELTEGRYTFTRVNDNTIQVNGKVDNSKTKAQDRQQAFNIAKQILQSANKSFDGHVGGRIINDSIYDPIKVEFKVSNQYIEHEYNKLPVSERTEQLSLSFNPLVEQDDINSNGGQNLREEFALHLSPLVTNIDPVVGYFSKYIEQKNKQLKSKEEELNRVEGLSRDPKTKGAELQRLNKERIALKQEIDGEKILGKVGLKDEIATLEKHAGSLAVAAYVRKDMDRLDQLTATNNPAYLKEALTLSDFYIAAGEFQHNDDNPFFMENDIYQPDTNGNITPNSAYLLPKDVMDQFRDWSNYAKGKKIEVEEKLKQVSVDIVNNNSAVQKTYGEDKKFDFSDLIYEKEGLKDTDYASMWIMDITQGIWSHNGILPQTMFSLLTQEMNNEETGSREINEAIDEINPKVIDKLHKLNQSLKKLGIISSNGVTYEIFKEKTKDGHETGNFITKFTPEFAKGMAKAVNKFWTAHKAASTIQDEQIKKASFNQAFKDLRDWRRANTVIIDPAAIDEIITDPEFVEFTHKFNSIKATTHKANLIKLIGQKEYDRQVADQKSKLRTYAADRQGFIDTLMVSEGVTDIKNLSAAGWNSIDLFEKRESPFHGAEEFNKVIYDVHINNYNRYNTFVPRRVGIKQVIDKTGYNINFEDQTNQLGYYNENYEKYIETDADLSKFHDLLLASNDFIRSKLTFDQQKQFQANSLPSMLKSSAEVLLDNSEHNNALRKLFASFSNMWETLRKSFGVIQQSEKDHTVINPITGKAEYKVNDSFLSKNYDAIKKKETIETTRFMQAYNSTLPSTLLTKIGKFTTIQAYRLNPATQRLLAEYLDVDISKLSSITGDNIEIGRIIKDYAVHTVVQSYSFDLAKLMKHGNHSAAVYSARNKALPVLDIMKNHYDSIKNPKINNVSKTLFSALTGKVSQIGERERAKSQMEDWFNRVVLGNYGLKHTGIFGSKKEGALIGEKIYSKEEKKEIKEINDLIKNETDQKKIDELVRLRDAVGRTRTTTALADNFMAWIRTMRLGFNLSSGVSNFIEGWMSNMIISATGDYFDPKEIYYGYSVARSSFLKNASFGKWEAGSSKKNRVLMDKFRVLMDTYNELQKNSTKTLADKLDWLHPHSINSRVEFVNQSPIMIAMLRTMKIKDENGKESSVWDAYKDDGTLKDEFKKGANGQENIDNWEKLEGTQHKNFKDNLLGVLVKAHGNYDTMRGMMAKSTTVGKAFMMFKSWIPQQLYWRFAVEQPDILSGQKSFKGKYRSYGKGNALLHGAIVGTVAFGPIGLAVGGTLGLALGAAYGADSGVGALQESITSARILVAKMFGMPLNTAAGKQLVDLSGKSFDKSVGYTNSDGKVFTQQDANALKSNMADIGMQLMMFALMLMVKAMFWDDKDKPDDNERLAHNFLVNRLMNLSSQAGMYVNPTDISKSTIESNAIISYLKDVAKETDRVELLFEGRDVIQSGQNAGESGLLNQTKKMVMPGVFKSIETGGFDTQMERQIQKSPWDETFKSQESKDMEANKRERASRKNELEANIKPEQFEGTPDEQEKQMKHEIMKQLNEELPTPTKLKKLGETRKQYLESMLQK